MEKGGRGRTRPREQAGDHATTRDLMGTEPSCHLQPVANIHPLHLGFIFLHLQDDSTAKFSSGQRMWVVQGESLLLSKPQKNQGRFYGGTRAPSPRPCCCMDTQHLPNTKIPLGFPDHFDALHAKTRKTGDTKSIAELFLFFFFLAPRPHAVVVI